MGQAYSVDDGALVVAPSVISAVKALQGEPRPLPLISVAENRSLELHRDNLKEVMNQVKPGTPVAIISVVGAFRTGKSFLLSWFVRILSRKKGRRVGGGNGRTNGFSWKGGEEPHTKGMAVWSKPFFQEVDDGEGGRTEMAVLLVDTQGLFDHETDVNLDSCLFGLSTTLSSCQIFNVRNQVQADTLSTLAAYLELGTVADDDQSGGEQDSEVPFQRLEVLIRDWQNWKRRDDPRTGHWVALEKQFKDYLDTILGNNSERVEGSSNGSIEKEKINGCFRDPIGCFGLPHPGNDVTWGGFDGEVDLIDHGFSNMVQHFIEKIILGEKLKKEQARLPNGSKGQFLGEVEGWVKLFDGLLSNGSLPAGTSWLGKMYEMENNKSIDDVFAKFKRDVAEQSKEYVRQDKLHEVIVKLKREAVGSLRLKGTKEVKNRAKEALKDKMDGHGTRLQRDNRKRATWGNIAAEALMELWKVCNGKGSRSSSEFIFGH